MNYSGVSCQNGCGRRGIYKFGLCAKCRKSSCKTCKKVIMIDYVGQMICRHCGRARANKESGLSKYA